MSKPTYLVLAKKKKKKAYLSCYSYKLLYCINGTLILSPSFLQVFIYYMRFTPQMSKRRVPYLIALPTYIELFGCGC